MSIDLMDRVHRAVAEGYQARSAYYAMIELADEQELGPPASEASIHELEVRFGKRLPPSYRSFLLLHDGWSMAAGAMDLLPIREMLEGPRARRIENWRREALEWKDLVGAYSLVIGDSEITPTKLLLDPNRVSEDGEWTVVQHYHGEECSYPSFLTWLEESVEEYRALVQEGVDDDLEE